MPTMNECTPVSIVMAACNGMPFIHEQIQSILVQMEPEDELIVSLDPSRDESEKVIRSFQDPRIRLIEGPGKGAVANFENGLKQAGHEIIFLSDQDDVWDQNKRTEMMKALNQPGVILAVHDAATVDENLQITDPSFFKSRPLKKGYVNNIIKNCFMGCCMAFKKELLETALPFPEEIPMHDQWLGLLALKSGKAVFVEKPLILYRRHEKNVSSIRPSGLLQQLVWRFHLLKALHLRLAVSKSVKNL